MATGSEVSGSCGGGICVSVELKNEDGFAVGGIFESSFGRQSGSELAAEVGDGARYWKPYRAV